MRFGPGILPRSVIHVAVAGVVAVTVASAVAAQDRYVAIFGGGFDRERLNRRGNWIYAIDIETGKTLLRANSSCGINAVTGCTPVYLGSIPSEPAALDVNEDGYLDYVYVGDMRGRMWRVDLTNLRRLASPPTGRFLLSGPTPPEWSGRSYRPTWRSGCAKPPPRTALRSLREL